MCLILIYIYIRAPREIYILFSMPNAYHVSDKTFFLIIIFNGQILVYDFSPYKLYQNEIRPDKRSALRHILIRLLLAFYLG